MLDEADRLLESSHFHELYDILSVLRSCGGGSGSSFKLSKKSKPNWRESSTLDREEGREVGKKETGGMQGLHGNARCNWTRQTLIVSATMSLELVQKVQFDISLSSNRTKKGPKNAGRTAFDKLLDAVAFKRKIKRIDLTTSKVLAAGLRESKVECLVENKDFYVYYFLLRFPGRTLIFVNSIDCLRRLSSILRTLKVDWFV